MGNILLTKTMEKADLDLESYDRLFPNQDTMPKGGFGNLIALPFQGNSAKEGKTVFVNQYFEPEENQMEILLNIRKLETDEIYHFVEKYQKEDYDEPIMEEIIDDEIPKKENLKDTTFVNNMECILDNQIYIKKLKLLPNEITYLKRLASFTNPKFYELQKLRMPIFFKTTPRIISCFEEDERFLILPRGCMDKIAEICEKSNVKLIVKDTRETGDKTDYEFSGKLNKKQEKAKQELLKYDTGVLCATTGFGKTVVASSVIAELKTNTLVIVNRNSLLEQWKDRLYNLEKMVSQYGLVIVDECHHVAAFSFEKVLKSVKSKYVYGLTTTPTRKDGWHKIIYMQCGDIRIRVSPLELKQNKEMEHLVIVRKTNYQYVSSEEKVQIAEILNDMCHNPFRNSIIAGYEIME